MHVTFISITYDFQWYVNVTVELLILHWFFPCKVCIITFKKQVWPQGHNKAKLYSVTQCYKVTIPRSHNRHCFISTGAWKMFGLQFVTLRYIHLISKTSIYINLKYHTVVHECFGNIKIQECSSMCDKFPSCSFLLSYLNDNVFAVRPAYIFG